MYADTDDTGYIGIHGGVDVRTYENVRTYDRAYRRMGLVTSFQAIASVDSVALQLFLLVFRQKNF